MAATAEYDKVRSYINRILRERKNIERWLGECWAEKKAFVLGELVVGKKPSRWSAHEHSDDLFELYFALRATTASSSNKAAMYRAVHDGWAFAKFYECDARGRLKVSKFDEINGGISVKGLTLNRRIFEGVRRGHRRNPKDLMVIRNKFRVQVRRLGQMVEFEDLDASEQALDGPFVERLLTALDGWKGLA